MGKDDTDDFRRAFGGHGFKTGFLKLTLLKLISKRPSHGYALMKEIERYTEDDWKPSPGSIYPALQELKGKGLVSDQEQGRQKIYTITEAGCKVLDQSVVHLKMVIGHMRAIFSEEEL